MNNPEIQVIDAISEDAKGIADMRKITWLDTYPNKEFGITTEDIETKDLNSEKKIQELIGYITNPNGTSKTWVAKRGGEVLGYCTATKYSHNEIRAIYVLPGYQGVGLGAKLLNTALSWFGETGDASEVLLYAASYNTKAIEFYNKFGFVETDRPVPAGYQVNGKPIPLTAMVRFTSFAPHASEL